MTQYELLVKNVKVVSADAAQPADLDIAVKDGKFANIAPNIDPVGADTVLDAKGRFAFPGVVDSHQHWGIYNELPIDTTTESKACAQGGVTTAINYMRTGKYYLNQGGPYESFMPKVFDACEGRAYIDYAFHVAPMSAKHIEEIPMLIEKYGITSFKIFMFYGGFGLHGASTSQREFLMLDEGERYDYAHFEFVMRGVQRARQSFPNLSRDISLSLHCETAEIMRAYQEIVQREGKLHGLEAYSASRPPHSEGLAISIASYLAHETALPTINLLHLSSRKAVEAALAMGRAFPHIDFRREVTIGHLLVDYNSASGLGGKVNPPLRPREDVESLWQHLLDGDIDWVVSDHACCRDETKFGNPRDDVFVAKSGFGGTEYLLAGLITEGAKRGLSYQRIAQLTSRNPAARYGLHTKGSIAVGYDADFALVDTSKSWVVHAADSQSSQEYTPFEGLTMGARVTDTYVRGHAVLTDGSITAAAPQGRYLRRPTHQT